MILFFPISFAFSAPADRYFRVEASSFEYSPPVIHVNQGDRVTIDLVSKDVVHGISIDGYGLSTSADPGQTKRIRFVASRSGTFRFRCTVACGALHPFMIGKLNVGTNWLLVKLLVISVMVIVAGIWSFQA